MSLYTLTKSAVYSSYRLIPLGLRNYHHAPSIAPVRKLYNPKETIINNLSQEHLEKISKYSPILLNALMIESELTEKGFTVLSQSVQKKYVVLWKVNAMLEKLCKEIHLIDFNQPDLDPQLKGSNLPSYIPRAGEAPAKVDAQTFAYHALRNNYRDNKATSNRSLVMSVIMGILGTTINKESALYYFPNNSSNIPQHEREQHFLSLLDRTFEVYGFKDLYPKFRPAIMDLVRRCDLLPITTLLTYVLPNGPQADRLAYASKAEGVPCDNPSLFAAWVNREAEDVCPKVGSTRQARLVMNNENKILIAADATNPKVLNALQIEEKVAGTSLPQEISSLFEKSSGSEASPVIREMANIDSEADELLEELREEANYYYGDLRR